MQSSQARKQQEGIAEKCLLSIHKYLPGATIALSTWKGLDISHLEYDKLVLSVDPGQYKMVIVLLITIVKCSQKKLNFQL